MRISLDWLRDWVDVGSDVAELAHALTMAGLEIEGVHRAGPELNGVVVGEVLAVEKHPNAEKLSICRVSDGREQLQIVCGAPNVRAGMKAPLAKIGAVLPNGVTIKQAKLRGVDSFGMLCSAKELALAEDANGLYELPATLTVGAPLSEALALNDTILEVNLTPNRGDCMSVLGLAREVAAIRRTPLRNPAQARVEAVIDETFPVRLEAPEACSKFVGRVIKGVTPDARSPFWMQERLRRAGIRPINAVVDVTNYVMLELGQPMHAYDLSSLRGAVVVRHARAGETLTLLDGRTVELTPDVLVIADEHTVLGMAGVMGGENSGIRATTTDVFLEVAYFDPDSIAGRGRRYGLITDASQRFERGVDPELQERASERATQLLIECAGGQPGPLHVVRHEVPVRDPIRLRHKRVQRVLGAAISADEVADCLRRLQIELREASSDGATAWLAVPPSWRFDLRIEEDLIEEVARLYGYDNIPETPAPTFEMVAPFTEARVSNERAADVLVDRGYQEAITYSFTDARAQEELCGDAGLALQNPISAELGAMRVSLWPGLIEALRQNQRRQQTRVRLFEIGRRYASEDGAETEVIAGLAAGPRMPEQWDVQEVMVDFFDVKADVEALLTLTGAKDEFRFVRAEHPALHPGQSARILRGDRPVGWLGALHPRHVQRLDLTYPAVLFELETASALAARVPAYAEISKYPAIRRDIAPIVDEDVASEAVMQVVRTSAGTLLKDLDILSVYSGPQIEKGKKSIALALVLQDTSRTLTDSEADAVVARILESLRRELNARIRE
ncbi:MAG: phenylalanine--tRNA ligase subunit beta [Gammaproteobacteria bacterium]|nr:phenylalanine--tRNA ligase subunit beta [Gammaproteobacteria bacterium]